MKHEVHKRIHFTSAGSSVRRHGVSVLGARTLVAAGNVHTLIGAQVADGLGTLVDICENKGEVIPVKLIHKLVQTQARDKQCDV